MESTGSSGSAAAAQPTAQRREPSTAPLRSAVASSPTPTTTKQDRSPRTDRDDDLDNDSDQDDPVFDPPLRRVSVSGAATATRSSHPVDPPADTTIAGGTAFRDGPVKRKKLGGLVWELENKGAVARDHLALERTFLAWLRTSLALASIGIAVTQLFRLPSGTATVPETSSSSLVDTSPPSSPFLINSLATSSYPAVAALAPVLASQQAQLATLSQNVSHFSYLAKPIGGTFLALALLFLALGTYRFFHVQAAFVSEPSMFPPSQKTYGFSTFCIGALIVATFAAVLATS